MDLQTLTTVIAEIENTLEEGTKETEAVLGDSEMLDSYKKNELIRLLANAQVELQFVLGALKIERDRKANKKFYQFWK